MKISKIFILFVSIITLSACTSTLPQSSYDDQPSNINQNPATPTPIPTPFSDQDLLDQLNQDDPSFDSDFENFTNQLK